MAQNLGDVVTLTDFYSQNNYTEWDYTSHGGKYFIANQQMTFVKDFILDGTDSSEQFITYITFEAPKIIFNTTTGVDGISIRNNGCNKLILLNASVNFDNAKYDTSSSYIGPIEFSGTSAINITTSSVGKTLIKASTLTGTVSLDVEDGVQDGDTFLIQATDNQLVITDGEWTATPSTSGNITTYTLAKAAPSVKTRFAYTSETGLPANFTEVEYLESTGTQWFDIGTTVNTATDEIELYFQLTETNNYKWFFGECDENNRIGLGSGDGTNKRNFLYKSSVTKINDVDMYNSQHHYLINSDGGFLDGVKKANYSAFSSTSTLYLFNLNIDSASDYKCKCKIWYYKQKRNGVLIRDMVPCLDSSNVPCMFDKVSGQAFYNQGTGSFTYGRKIIPVEYLESSGTQYIDLGLKGKNGYDFDYKFNSTRIDSTAYGIGGEWESGNSCYLGLIRNNNKFAYHYDGTQSPIEIETLTANTDYSVQVHLYSGEQYYVLNGDKSAVGTITGTFTSTANLNLFRVNSSSPLYSYIKVYYLKIWDNGTLVMDMIPCKDENNVGYMFDRVSHSVYLNAGTGAFTYGAELPKKKVRLIKDSKRRVPKGFKEVEYLENTQTGASRNWINTGVVSNSNTQLEVCISYNDVSTGKLMGSGYAGNTRFNFGIESNKFRFGLGSGWFDANSSISTPDTKPHIWILDSATQTGIIDGYSQTTTLSLPDTNIYPITLFARSNNDNGNAETANTTIGKIYYVKIWKNNVLVRDMIPCLDASNVPCMWDKVNGKAYYNEGTGSFTYGHTIKQVKYLESSGTQYIDTGWSPNSNDLRVQFKAKSMGSPLGTAICGSEKTGTTPRWIFIMFGQSGNSTKTYPLTGTWNNTSSDTAFTFTSGTTLDIDWVANSTSTTITDKISNTSYTQAMTSTINYPNNNVTLKLFCNSTTQKSSIQMNYYKIYDNGTLVRDFIPVKDENGVGYLLDTISHTLYNNAGTGSFTVGAEIKSTIRFLKGK